MRFNPLRGLQTTSQRFALVDTADKPRPELRPGENIDVVVSHEIKELGVRKTLASQRSGTPNHPLVAHARALRTGLGRRTSWSARSTTPQGATRKSFFESSSSLRSVPSQRRRARETAVSS